MAQITPQVAHARATVASLTRSRKADDPDLGAAREQLREAQLEDYIRKTVDGCPPLSPEQQDRLVVLLRGKPLRAEHPRPDLKAIEEARRSAQLLVEARALSNAVLACDVCDKPPAAHSGRYEHAWVPGRAERIMREQVWMV